MSKEKKIKELPYRNGVGIVVLNDKNEIFVAKRIDNPKNFWQMPQGGVDKDENYYDAALRELKESSVEESLNLLKTLLKKTSYALGLNPKKTSLGKNLIVDEMEEVSKPSLKGLHEFQASLFRTADDFYSSGTKENMHQAAIYRKLAHVISGTSDDALE